MDSLAPNLRRIQLPAVALACLLLLPSCYIFNFFGDDDKKSSGGGDSSVFTGTVIGQPLGDRAGGADEAALAGVHAITTDQPPAAIRPDPDLYVRRLLRQYRPEGSTIARQIGDVEQFRLLLGGAPQDFSTNPRDSYDATSLLAVFKVAEEVCRGLVAPNQWEHPGWSTILPLPPENESENLLWLAQRFIGKPSSQIEGSVVTDLLAVMAAEEPYLADEYWAEDNPFAKYVPACATLALDAEALYL